MAQIRDSWRRAGALLVAKFFIERAARAQLDAWSTWYTWYTYFLARPYWRPLYTYAVLRRCTEGVNPYLLLLLIKYLIHVDHASRALVL
jgi:hypothetical protein